MHEYTPLDLKTFHNAGLALLAEQGAAPIGPQQFRGLPFLIGTDPQCCFIAFGDGWQNASLSIPIAERARSVIVAHRLLVSGISAGGPVGQPIAEYVFTYQNGDEERLTIRDRFEITEIPTAWGQLPFRAVPDQSDKLPPRDTGLFDESGERQTEVNQATACSYYLWAWQNPHSEEPLAALTIVPAGPCFLIAGVTLGHADEYPFVRSGARPLKMIITDAVAATQPFDLASSRGKSNWKSWYIILKQVLPIYLALHLALLVATILTTLFALKNFAPQALPLSTLWQMWRHQDAVHYIYLTTQGYTEPWRTAFFPFYPLLIKGVAAIIGDPLLAGLFISNAAGLVMLVVLYQLVKEDFDAVRAERVVLYLSLFPTAFFFAAPYNEALFLCLTLLSFYSMRRGRWWLAGIYGLGASLTRSAGLLLLAPFIYEYLRLHTTSIFHAQRRWFGISWRTWDLNMLAGLLIPAGTGLFALYCYQHFNDPLAFSHAQSQWSRQLAVPWWGLMKAFFAIRHSSGLLSYQALHNLIELMPTLLTLVLLVLSTCGPWRFPRTHIAYILYGALLFLFFQLVPINWIAYPLESQGRFMLEIFPAFIILATVGKYRFVHYSYLLIATAAFFLLLAQFLSGYWII